MPYANIEDRRAHGAAYRAANREKIRAYTKAWKASHPEDDHEHDRRYLEKNRVRISIKNAEYRASDHGKEVRREEQRRRMANISVHQRKMRAVNSARQNARKHGREFAIAVADLHWPDVCPVLGIRLNYGKSTNGLLSYDTPSLDRHDHAKGYVKGNVVVMSWRANMLKRDASLDEIAMLFEYLRKTRSN